MVPWGMHKWHCKSWIVGFIEQVEEVYDEAWEREGAVVGLDSLLGEFSCGCFWCKHCCAHLFFCQSLTSHSQSCRVLRLGDTAQTWQETL